jgi:hypothetical protein
VIGKRESAGREENEITFRQRISTVESRNEYSPLPPTIVESPQNKRDSTEGSMHMRSLNVLDSPTESQISNGGGAVVEFVRVASRSSTKGNCRSLAFLDARTTATSAAGVQLRRGDGLVGVGHQLRCEAT